MRATASSFHPDKDPSPRGLLSFLNLFLAISVLVLLEMIHASPYWDRQMFVEESALCKRSKCKQKVPIGERKEKTTRTDKRAI